jgi:GAF domain-containing protein
MHAPNPHLQQLRTLLAGGDVRAALAFLNGRTEHRFTSLYRFDDATLRNIHFFDRENPQQTSVEDIPVLASYCVFVRDSRSAFDIDDSLEDERVAGHPKQAEIRSYCGVPLLDELGRMFGTICHFDFEPRPISDENVALMEAVAPQLQRYSA